MDIKLDSVEVVDCNRAIRIIAKALTHVCEDNKNKDVQDGITYRKMFKAQRLLRKPYKWSSLEAQDEQDLIEVLSCCIHDLMKSNAIRIK